MNVKKLNFCNLKISNISFNEILNYTNQCIENNTYSFIVPLSLKLFVKSIFSKRLRDHLNSVDILIPVSMFLFFLIRLSYKDYNLKYSEIKDLVSGLIIKHNADGTTYVFIGSTLNGLSIITRNLKMSFKDIKIVGLYPEEFFIHKNDELTQVLKKIKPSLIFVDYKEKDVIKWVLSSKESLKNSVIILCEKMLRRMAGEISDVPYSFKKRNLEYIYKFMNNPFHIFDIFIFSFVFLYFLFFTIKKIFNRG